MNAGSVLLPIVVSTPQWSLNGVNSFNTRLVQGLCEQNISAHILVTSPDKLDTKPMPLLQDIPIVHLPVHVNMSWRKRWALLQKYLIDLSPCIYLPNHDTWHSGIVPTLPSTIKVVAIAHSDDQQHYEHIQRLGKYCDRVVAVSAFIKGEIGRIIPAVSHKTIYIPYGVMVPTPLVEDETQQKPIRIIYAGRLDNQQKQVSFLPLVAMRLRRNNVPFLMTIVGNGKAKDSLNKVCRIHNDMQLIDTLPLSELQRLYAQHDIFLLPSAYEGLPLGLLESMASGCVPVTSDLRSGIPEMVEHEQNGLRIKIGDVDQFVAAITQLQQRPEWRAQLAQQAVATVRKTFSLEQMIAAYVTLFESVSAETDSFTRPIGPIKPPPEFTWKHHLPAYMQQWGVAAKRKLL